MLTGITRYVSISALAIVITLGCFMLMQRLLDQPAGEGGDLGTGPVIVFEDIKIPEYEPPPPREPKPEHEPPPELPQPDTAIPKNPVEVAMNIPDLNLLPSLKGEGPGIQGNTNPPNLIGAGDDQLVKMYEVLPPYPVEGTLAGIEGWVKVQFTVNAAGTVIDVAVLDSQPKRFFDATVINTVRKWRFKPRSLDAAPLSAIQVIDFSLDSD